MVDVQTSAVKRQIWAAVLQFEKLETAKDEADQGHKFAHFVDTDGCSVNLHFERPTKVMSLPTTPVQITCIDLYASINLPSFIAHS